MHMQMGERNLPSLHFSSVDGENAPRVIIKTNAVGGGGEGGGGEIPRRDCGREESECDDEK
jgi:hypothetical protein